MNRCYEKIRGGNCTLYIHRDFHNDTFEQALLYGEKKLREQYQLTAVPSSKSARVYKLTVGFDGMNKGIYFKQYFCRSAWDFIKGFMRAGRAERSLKATEMLSENGFDVPAIIAMGKRVLVTLEIEDAKPVHQLISDGKLETRNKRRLIRAFGQTIGKMHAKGIFHGDLRLGNILARHDKGQWRFFFLDNERTRKFYHLPGRLRLKNLVQVNMFQSATISNTDRMRFFKEYWAQNKKAKANKADLIKKALKKTRQRLDKKQKFKSCKTQF